MKNLSRWRRRNFHKADDEARRTKEWNKWKAAHLRQAWKPPRLTLSILNELSKLLPIFSDVSLRAIEVKSSDWTQTYVVNLLDYTCTCPLCLGIHAGVPPRDFGRLCKHIIIALRREKLVIQFPPSATEQQIMATPKPTEFIQGALANDLNGNPIYITGKNYDRSINVYALTRRNGVNYYRYGFDTIRKSWCRIMPSGAYIGQSHECMNQFCIRIEFQFTQAVKFSRPQFIFPV